MDEWNNRVISWIMEMGMSLNDTPGSKEAFNKTVTIQSLNSPLSLNVIRPKEDSKFYVIAMGIGIHPIHLQKLQSLKPEEQKGLFQELKYTYLSMNVEFMFIPPQDKIPKAISVLKNVFIDGLTQDRFFEVFSLVKNAGFFTILKLIDRLGEVNQDSSLSPGRQYM